MILSRAILSVLFILIFETSLLTKATPINVEDPDVCNTPACRETAQALRDSMDTSADPCQDFYRYACGGWVEKHPIPAETTEYSATNVMSEQVENRVGELIRTALNENHVRPIVQAATLFQGCIDEDARERQGMEPLKNFLDSVGGWPMINPDWSGVGYQWQEQVANIIRLTSTDIIIGILIDADERDSSRHIVKLDQAEFGLGRDQLLDSDSSKRNKRIVRAYKNFIVETAKLLNPNADEDQIMEDAEDVIRFEKALAQFSKPPEEKKDPETLYNKMTVTEADTVTENVHFKWKDFLNIIFQDYPEVTDETDIIVYDIDFLKNAIKLAHDSGVRTVANYIGWILAKGLGEETTKAFRENEFNFNSVRSGVEKPEKLESSCSETVVDLFSFAVGRLYIDHYFTEQEKRDVEIIVQDIRSTYELTLNHNPWMDPDTKSKALEKLRSMINMVAYPEWIKNDQELISYYRSVPDINKEEYFVSMMKVGKALTAKTLEKWDEPKQRTTEWNSPLTTVNAFYSPNANTVTLPAGILNQPMYKYGRSVALNYGAIGSVIGHEISHGFDDEGSQFDKEGNLVNWWTEEAKDEFDEKSTCFRNQYSSYVEPITNTRLNGNLTIGDDIADNGGIRNAYLAYKIRVMESEDQQTTVTNKKLPGIAATPDQLFFIGYASWYCWHESEDTLQWTIENSDHTIDKYRVIIPLTNSRDFADAFNCPLGSPLNPASKCLLW